MCFIDKIALCVLVKLEVGNVSLLYVTFSEKY